MKRLQTEARAIFGAGLLSSWDRLGVLTHALAAAETTRQAVTLLAAEALKVSGADVCRVALLAPNGAAFSQTHTAGFAPGAEAAEVLSPDGLQPLCKAIRTRTPLFLEYPPQPNAPDTLCAEAALPLLGSTVRGGISLGFTKVRRFPRTERLFLTLLSQIAALGIERAEATMQMQELRAETKESEAALHQIVAAQEEERRHFSRELHDETGQYLTVLALKLRALRDNLAPEDTAQNALRQMEHLVEEMGREIHRLAVRLRPTALDDTGLSEALLNYLDDWGEDTGMTVDFHSTGLDTDRLPLPVEITIYRLVQEALNNTFKHAEAAHISLILERDAHSVQVIIEDDGQGFDADALANAPPRRLGLAGMQERAAAAGGQCTIESSPGSGTTVFLRLPLNTAREQKA